MGKKRKICQSEGCVTPVKFLKGGKRDRCGTHGGFPLCQHPGCVTPVKFLKGGKRDRCITHGGYPLCLHPGCVTPVQFKEGGQRERCKTHGGYPLCQYPGCVTPVCFKKGGQRDRCSTHGGYPLCQYPGCVTPVSFKEGGQRDRCGTHGGYPLCQHPGCVKPVKFLKGGQRNRCSTHGGFPLCQYPGCVTPVCFKEGGQRDRCSTHGGFPLCQHPGCVTPVQFKEGGKRDRCSTHGGYPKCSSCGLFGIKKQGLRCSYCRPGSATAKRAKKEEEAVAEFLADFVFQREVHISYCCLDQDSLENKRSARLDFVIELPTHRVILEVDENQHKSETYNVACDVARMTHVMGAIACTGERPTIWIRFNPNAYAVDGVTQKKPKLERYQALEKMIQQAVEGTKVVYMYYDTQEGQAVVTLDVAYPLAFKKLLLPCVL